MPSPKEDPYLLETWRRLEIDYVSSGLSRWKALKKIGKDYSVAAKTVYYWLTPTYRAHEVSMNRSDTRIKQKRNWANRPNNKARLYAYSRKYQHYRSHLDLYIQDIFLESEGSPMSLLSISQKLRQTTKTKFDRKVILMAIAKHNYEHKEHLIEEIEPDLYHMMQ